MGFIVTAFLVLSLACRAVSSQTERDILTTNKTKPPVIDVSPIINSQFFSTADQILVRQQILDAAHKWGFFQVINHGISAELQQNLTEQMKLFFASTQEVKHSIKRTESNSRGFADDELTKRLKDVKEILDIGQVRSSLSIRSTDVTYSTFVFFCFFFRFHMQISHQKLFSIRTWTESTSGLQKNLCTYSS